MRDSQICAACDNASMFLKIEYKYVSSNKLCLSMKHLAPYTSSHSLTATVEKCNTEVQESQQPVCNQIWCFSISNLN